MNNLSWFIYLTQVVEGARDVIAGGIALAIIGVAVIGIPLMAFYLGEGFDENKYTAEDKYISGKMRHGLKLSAVVLVGGAALATIIPSRQTMLLIAGSEMGERAISSSAVQDVVNPGVDLLKTWIKEETDKLKSKK